MVEGHRQYNPGWHLAIDLRNMLLVSECIAKAALTREESRGGHTRDDFPDRRRVGSQEPRPAARRRRHGVDLSEQPLPVMPDELKTFFEEK